MSSSRIPRFYQASLAERRRVAAEFAGLSADDLAALDRGGLDLETAEHMIENVIGLYALPLGLGLNFTVNGKDYLVPMVVEEPSVVAAASNAAKMVRAGGGFQVDVSAPLMIAQIQISEVADTDAAVAALEARKADILERGRAILHRLVKRGGGPRDMVVRVLPGESERGEDDMLVVHVVVDCRDAMGANMVNTLAEGLADELAGIAGGRPGLRILSNLTDQRTVTVTATVPDSALCPGAAGADSRAAGDSREPGDPAADPAIVRRAIVAASRFAERDPYRAATHNKGIMNGVDAVLLALGNDWRGVEAGAHAFACQEGRYRPLAIWSERDGVLTGRLHMPMAVATVGGALHVHQGARLALAVLGVEGAGELAAVAGSVGLASNLAALRALATHGIQRGHMALHARMVARSAGARGVQIDRVAAELSATGDITVERARTLLQHVAGAAAAHPPPAEESP